MHYRSNKKQQQTISTHHSIHKCIQNKIKHTMTACHVLEAPVLKEIIL